MIIAITNLKGGVGKSMISRNLAVYFALQGEKVCIIDTDIEQRTTCDWRDRRVGETDLQIDVFPMSSTQGLVSDIKTHRSNGYRVIIIDGVPQLEEVTTKMMLIANFLVIPVTPSIDDLKSFERFLRRYEDAKTIKGDIPAFVVLNRFDRTAESDEMQKALSLFEKYGVTALTSVIGERVAHKRTSKYGLPALEWDDRKAKREIEKFCREIETRLLEKLEVTS